MSPNPEETMAENAGDEMNDAQAEDEADKQDDSDDPSTGQMVAQLLSGEDSMKWESKLAAKLGGAEDETAPEDS